MAKKLQVTGPVMAMAPLCVQTTVEATGRDSGGKLQEVTDAATKLREAGEILPTI